MSSSLPADPTDDDGRHVFWVGDGAAEHTLTAEELLAAFEEGRFAADVPVRIQQDAAPQPLARYITELVWTAHRRRSSLKVRESDRSLFETAFQRAPIGMVLSDLLGRIRHANQAFCTLVGYDQTEICQLRVGQVSDARDREQEIALGNDLLSGRRDSFQIEKRFRTKTGEVIDALTSIALVRLEDGTPGWVIAHVQDTTTLRELQFSVEERTRQLRGSEERFAQLFRFAPQATLIVDREQRVVQANQRAQTLFGYDEGEFPGLAVAALVPAAVRERHDQLMRDFELTTSKARMAEQRSVQAIRADGSRFDAEVSLVSFEGAGEPQVLVGLTDITDRLAAEKAMDRSLREKATLLKEIHHRVKNNLQIISSLLMLQSERVSSEDARAQLHESVHRVRSMALIHEQLYGDDSLARIELTQYVATLGQYLRGAIAPNVRMKVQGAPLDVNIDEAVPLGLILNEVITNAIKYGLPRGPAGSPRRTGPDCDVLVEITHELGNVRIAVSDSGDGPPPAYDGRKSATLGFQLIRSLSRQLRGKVTMDSDGGTRFVIVCALRSV